MASMSIRRTYEFSRVAVGFFAASLVLLALAGFSRVDGATRERLNLAYTSAASLKQSLGSPALEYETVHITDAGAACITYHPDKDTSNAHPAQAVVHGGRVSRGQDDWNRHCLGLAFDATRAVRQFF
jgi:hypothetical protein